jgi:hypothetical protein
LAAVCEKPSSADRKATVFGFGLAELMIASTMIAT